MKTIAEIKAAIQMLSLSERAEFAKWFNGSQDDAWDKQIARDFAPGGRHASLESKVDKAIESGELLDLS